MPVDRELWALAARQHGVLAVWQLLAAGLSWGAISTLVARGWLRPMHRGVYLVGPIHAARTAHGRGARRG